MLASLEQGEQAGALSRLADDLPLFAASLEQTSEPESSAVEKELAGVEADALSPREALDLVYRLKELLSKDGTGGKGPGR